MNSLSRSADAGQHSGLERPPAPRGLLRCDVKEGGRRAFIQGEEEEMRWKRRAFMHSEEEGFIRRHEGGV